MINDIYVNKTKIVNENQNKPNYNKIRSLPVMGIFNNKDMFIGYCEKTLDGYIKLYRARQILQDGYIDLLKGLSPNFIKFRENSVQLFYPDSKRKKEFIEIEKYGPPKEIPPEVHEAFNRR